MVSKAKIRQVSSNRRDLEENGPLWKIIGRLGSVDRKFKEVAKRFWRSLNIGRGGNKRTLDAASKRANMFTGHYENGTSPFDRRVMSLWPTEVYDSEDESKMPADDWELCSLSSTFIGSF